MGKPLGIALAATTAVIWGGQWVIGKSALAHVDAFNLTTLRYAAAAPLMLATECGTATTHRHVGGKGSRARSGATPWLA